MARKGENMVLFGSFKVQSGTIDITDPGYDKDVWCRETQVNVLNGNYHCYYHKQELKDWGERIWCLRVVHEDFLDVVSKNPRRLGNVGVDAGLCGFFDNKPNYNCEEWADLCNKMEVSSIEQCLCSCIILNKK